MASNIVLSEEQVRCSICLDVFRKPVSTPCGHNYCQACITRYWDSSDLCQCPMCMQRFTERPQLRINTFISEMVDQMKRLSPVPGTSPTPELRPRATEPVEVPCDVCPGEKLKALKSCLVCLVSYCEAHLEPHWRVAAWTSHKLIDPVENLEDRVCKKHDRLLELFCRTDQRCVCRSCAEGSHRTHVTVPLEEEFHRKRAQLRRMNGDVEGMIRERRLKIQQVKQSPELRRSEAEREVADCIQTFTGLVRFIERSLAELTEAVEENQRTAEKRDEGFITELEQEIVELQQRSSELEKLSHTEDRLHLLHSRPSTSPFTPPPAHWPQISAGGGSAVGSVLKAVTELEKTLLEKLQTVKLNTMRRCAVDVTLDPDTAFSKLVLSKDGKQVRDGKTGQNVPNNPERFAYNTCVLGTEGFSVGRLYYEVQVAGKTEWILGVVRGTITRKERMTRSPENGHWSFGLWRNVGYVAHAGPDVVLRLKREPQKVGVFVDYDQGEVAFYDVEAGLLLYSFTACRFKETVYPCFSPGNIKDGRNSVPLIICPVSGAGLTL